MGYGIGAASVQTLSRLNRVHPDKGETMVLDFVNDADDIHKAFQPYYETTILSEGTDPNLLYDHQRKLLDFDIFGEGEVDAFTNLLRDGPADGPTLRGLGAGRLELRGKG